VSGVVDHVGIRVSDLPASRRMYAAALAELGFSVLGEGQFEGDDYVLFGRDGSDDFSLHSVGSKPGRDRAATGAHVAFTAPDAAAVDRWHRAALDHGATDNGPPGRRPEYTGDYYAAFVLDLDGNNVEAVFHAPHGVDDFEQLESRLLSALQRADQAEVSALLRDDFLITTAGWMPEPVDKETWLSGISGRMTLDSFALRVIGTRRYGDTAVALVESQQSGTHDGAPFSMTFRYTDTWVRDDGVWRLAIRHASEAPPRS